MALAFWFIGTHLERSEDPEDQELMRDLNNLPVSYGVLCLTFVLIWPYVIATYIQGFREKK